MRNSRAVELCVGGFIFLVVFALGVLAFRVSGSSLVGADSTYEITAPFSNIGGLKVRAAVRVSGVQVGYVNSIALNPTSYRAVVHMKMSSQFHFPVDSSASIYTQGLLGSNYVAITPGFEMTNMKSGAEIGVTHSALVLENLIGQLIYKNKDKKQDAGKDSGKASEPS